MHAWFFIPTPDTARCFNICAEVRLFLADAPYGCARVGSCAPTRPLPKKG
jgi:hypothetical protein